MTRKIAKENVKKFFEIFKTKVISCSLQTFGIDAEFISYENEFGFNKITKETDVTTFFMAFVNDFGLNKHNCNFVKFYFKFNDRVVLQFLPITVFPFHFPETQLLSQFFATLFVERDFKNHFEQDLNNQKTIDFPNYVVLSKKEKEMLIQLNKKISMNRFVLLKKIQKQSELLKKYEKNVCNILIKNENNYIRWQKFIDDNK